MANFKQHLAFAAVGTGFLTTPLLGANLINPLEALTLWISGTFGGLLPDIDSDNATVLELLFGLICLLAIGLTLAHAPRQLSTIEICLLIGFVYAAIFYGVRRVFAQFTVHRGIFHSLLAASFFGLLMSVMTSHILAFSVTLSWLCGFFLMMGFVLHLLLDELYSVDFMNAEIKRSFGTALKLTDYRNWKSTLGMLAAMGALCFLAPNPDPATELLFSKRSWTLIKGNLLPSTPPILQSIQRNFSMD
jgi:hypothetical protein